MSELPVDHHFDISTIVMANLGYFQFKAPPGIWDLGIRPGKGDKVYEVESVGGDGWKSGELDKTGTSLVVSTLEGLTLYPRFRRKPGYELAELLDEAGSAKTKPTTFATFADRVKSM